MASPGRHGDACPICLQAYPALDKAVISSCLHTFCITCLAAWCERKRACPVCRGGVSSYYHTINSDTVFLEHVFPPEHPLVSAGGDQQRLQQLLSAADAYIDDYDRTHPNSQQQQQQGSSAAGVDQLERRDVEGLGRSRAPRVQLVQERFTSWGDPEDWLHHIRQGHLQQQQQQQQQQDHNHTRGGSSSSGSNSRASRSHQQQQSGGYGSSGGSSAGQGGAAQPRPYFWRMQQHMMASLHHSSSNPLTNPGQAAEAAQTALLTRRAVYLSNRWAKPYTPASHSIPLSGRPGSSSSNINGTPGSNGSSSGCKLLPRVTDSALQSWLQRELQALLLDQDVTIVSMYVRGLINSFGLQQQQQQQQQQVNRPVPVSTAVGSSSSSLAMQQAAARAVAAVQQQQQVPVHAGSSHPAAAAGEGAAAGPAAGTVIPDAAAALQSFLFADAAHFWHELSCFAMSGLSVAAWDRNVKYGPPPGLAPAQQQQQQVPLGSDRRQQQQQPSASGPAAGSTAEGVCGTGPLTGAGGSDGSKRRRGGRSGWDVPPTAAAAAAAAVAPAPLSGRDATNPNPTVVGSGAAAAGAEAAGAGVPHMPATAATDQQQQQQEGQVDAPPPGAWQRDGSNISTSSRVCRRRSRSRSSDTRGPKQDAKAGSGSRAGSSRRRGRSSSRNSTSSGEVYHKRRRSHRSSSRSRKHRSSSRSRKHRSSCRSRSNQRDRSRRRPTGSSRQSDTGVVLVPHQHTAEFEKQVADADGSSRRCSRGSDRDIIMQQQQQHTDRRLGSACCSSHRFGRKHCDSSSVTLSQLQQQQQGLQDSWQPAAHGQLRQRQRESGGHVWVQAVILKQLGGAQPGTHMQHNGGQDDDRWQMD